MSWSSFDWNATRQGNSGHNPAAQTQDPPQATGKMGHQRVVYRAWSGSPVFGASSEVVKGVVERAEATAQSVQKQEPKVAFDEVKESPILGQRSLSHQAPVASQDQASRLVFGRVLGAQDQGNDNNLSPLPLRRTIATSSPLAHRHARRKQSSESSEDQDPLVKGLMEVHIELAQADEAYVKNHGHKPTPSFIATQAAEMFDLRHPSNDSFAGMNWITGEHVSETLRRAVSTPTVPEADSDDDAQSVSQLESRNFAKPMSAAHARNQSVILSEYLQSKDEALQDLKRQLQKGEEGGVQLADAQDDILVDGRVSETEDGLEPVGEDDDGYTSGFSDRSVEFVGTVKSVKTIVE